MLPSTRNRTYNSASPVISGDLDDIQDCIVAGKHGLLTLAVGVNALVLAGSAAAPVSFAHGAPTAYAADMVAAAQPVVAMLSVNLAKGTRIVNARLYLKDVAAQPALVTRLNIGNRAGASTTVSTVNSAASGATQTITHANVLYTIAAGDGPVALLLSTPTNVTGTYQLFAVELDIDKP